MQAPWWWSKTETCRSDIYVHFNVLLKIKKCICWWVNSTLGRHCTKFKYYTITPQVWNMKWGLKGDFTCCCWNICQVCFRSYTLYCIQNISLLHSHIYNQFISILIFMWNFSKWKADGIELAMVTKHGHSCSHWLALSFTFSDILVKFTLINNVQ